MEENRQNGIRDEKGLFVEGHENISPGRPPDTLEKKIQRKAIKEIVAEYKENLAQALPQIEPVIIEKAVKGDMVAVKEIHDRVMDKARQPTDLDIKGTLEIKFDNAFKKDFDDSFDITE